MPWIVQPHKDSFCVHRKNQDGSVGELVNNGCHATAEEAETHLRALYANVREMYDMEHETETMPTPMDECVQKHIDSGMTREEAIAACADHPVEEMSTNGDDSPLQLISEIGLMETPMKRGYPDIPFAPGIDPEEFVVEQITGYTTHQDGVPTPIKERIPPTFVTLKIAEVGLKSRQNILYDEELVNVIEQTIMQKRPGGIFGHPNPENADFEYPDPQGFWVGAKREGATLWGKAWIRDPEAARRVRDTGKVGGTLATSIWGRAKHEIKDGAIRLKNFLLERIDFAPPERASLPVGGGQFFVTAEMDNTGGQTVTPEELKAEIGKLPADVVINMLAPEVFTQVSEMVIRKNKVLGESGEQMLIAELTSSNTMKDTIIAEMTTELSTVKGELKTAKEELFDHDVDATVRKGTDWVVTTPKGKGQLEALRAYLRKGLVAEMREGEALKNTLERVMDDPSYKLVIEMTKKEIGGGALPHQSVEPRIAEQHIPSQDEIAAARARTGM